MSYHIPGLLQRVCNITSDPSSNLSITLQPVFENLHSPENGCNTCRKCRFRTFVTLFNLNYLRQDLYGISNNKTDEIIDVFMSICKRNMEQFDEDFWTSSLEPKLDRNLIVDSLDILCAISPKKHSETIKRLYCLNDEANGMKQHVIVKLKTLIEDSPLIVIDWIDAFHLYDFKTEHLQSLVLSCMIKNVDIYKYLMTADAFKDSVVSVLDGFVINDRSKHPSTKLLDDFFDMFPVSRLSTEVYELAYPYRLDIIPNTMNYRTIKIFENNFLKATSLTERRIMTVHALDCAKQSSTQIKEIIKIILNNKRDLIYALAVATFAKDSLASNHLNEIFPNYNDMCKIYQRAVNCEVGRLSKLKIPFNNEKITHIDCNGFRCIVVDTPQIFLEICSKLWHISVKNCIVAFDVEPSFVFESGVSSQDAALLQLAFTEKEEKKKKCTKVKNRTKVKNGTGVKMGTKVTTGTKVKNGTKMKKRPKVNTIYLIDIDALKKVLLHDEWETLFEHFLRLRLKRIGFDIKNKMMLLQNTFPFLGKSFAQKKPLFIDVHDTMKKILKNPFLARIFFKGARPELSLQSVTKALLDVKLEEQSENRLIRSVYDELMKYPASNAYYTLQCYFKIREKLLKRKWLQLKETICKIYEPSKLIKGIPILKSKDEETFEEVVCHLQKVMDEIQPKRKPEEVLIVLDAAYIKFRGVLKRCGFKTWDHRYSRNRVPDKTAEKMSTEFFYFLLYRSRRNTYPGTYVLTQKKVTTRHLMVYDDLFIFAHPNEPESVIMEKIIRKTLSSIDFPIAHKRCNSCGKCDYYLEIPMAAYRVIFKSFAIATEFTDNVDGLGDSMEKFINTFNSMSLELKSNCYIEDEKIIFKNDSRICRFSINGTDCNVYFGDERSTYKCERKLFTSKFGPDHVKFCWKCNVFY